MKRMVAFAADTESRDWTAIGTDGVVRMAVTDATLAHERHVAAEYTWPALPPRLRSLPDARAMVRHWVRTDYQWRP